MWPGRFRRLRPSSTERDRHTAHRSRQLDTNLAAGELKDHALLVLQLYAAGACSQSATGANDTVSPLDIGGTSQVEGMSRQLRGRGPDREAHTHPRHVERVMATMKC